MEASTIAAIATPPGNGGIGIVKISGSCAIGIARSIFRPASASARPENAAHQAEDALVSRRLYYGHIIDPDTDRVIDEVLVTVMRKPRSYTAEDVVEIQAHAGVLVLKTILNLLVEKGARLAEPGEFTKRAFLNGRIDLTQAEAVIDIINARSASAVDMAAVQITGGLSRAVASFRSALADVLTGIEAVIDFSDDADIPFHPEVLIDRLEQDVAQVLQSLIRRHADENFLREGLKVVIVGGPNVGKSSLMNRLINRERAIVTEIPGTTRDFIEESFTARGIPIVVTDTAGIRENPDPIERIGIEKAWDYIASADIILFTMDAGRPATPTDLDLFQKLKDKKRILVINKTDLPKTDTGFRLPPEWAAVPRLEVSALYNRGIEVLKDLIAGLAFGGVTDTVSRIVPNMRQKMALESCLASTRDAVEGLRRAAPLELISIDVRSALQALAEITGERADGGVLENIFSRFCIGK
jgi:tRNA modification GTPase